MASPNAVGATGMVGSLIDKTYKTELRRTEQTLELWRVNNVAFEVT